MRVIEYESDSDILQEPIIVMPQTYSGKSLWGMKFTISHTIPMAQRDALIYIIYERGGTVHNTITNDSNVLISSIGKSNDGVCKYTRWRRGVTVLCTEEDFIHFVTQHDLEHKLTQSFKNLILNKFSGLFLFFLVFSS